MKMSEKSFYVLIKPLLIFGKLLGTVSFTFDEKGYYQSKYLGVVLIVVAISYAAFTVAGIYVRINFNFTSSITTITDILQITSTAIQIISIWITSACFQCKHIKLLKCLEETQKKLRTLGPWIYFSSKQKIIWAQIIVRLIVIIVSCIVQHVYLEFGNHAIIIIFDITFYFPMLINAGLCAQISTYIMIVKDTYVMLNQHLNSSSKLGKKFPQNKKWLKMMAILKSKQSLIQSTSPLYHELNKILYLINTIFGISLLTTFGVSLMTIIIDSYYILLLMQHSNDIQMGGIFSTMCNCAPYVLDAFYLCYLCNITVEEVIS